MHRHCRGVFTAAPAAGMSRRRESAWAFRLLRPLTTPFRAAYRLLHRGASGLRRLLGIAPHCPGAHEPPQGLQQPLLSEERSADGGPELEQVVTEPASRPDFTRMLGGLKLRHVQVQETVILRGQPL